MHSMLLKELGACILRSRFNTITANQQTHNRPRHAAPSNKRSNIQRILSSVTQYVNCADKDHDNCELPVVQVSRWPPLAPRLSPQ